MCKLKFCDVQNLHNALGSSLWSWAHSQHTFWDSRFWYKGELEFASSILPASLSRQEQFFIITKEMQNGVQAMNLRNRKRIWHITSGLIDVIYAMSRSERRFHSSSAPLPLSSHYDPAPNCVALEDDKEGCRELRNFFAPVDGQLQEMVVYYENIFDRCVVSGLGFLLIDRTEIIMGYSSGLKTQHQFKTDKLQKLWLVCGPSGFEHVSIDYPKDFLARTPHRESLGVAKFKINELSGFVLGLDVSY
jgi:hypothetical protein